MTISTVLQTSDHIGQSTLRPDHRLHPGPHTRRSFTGSRKCSLKAANEKYCFLEVFESWAIQYSVFPNHIHTTYSKVAYVDIKEHVAITIFASTAASSALAISIFAADDLYYGFEVYLRCFLDSCHWFNIVSSRMSVLGYSPSLVVSSWAMGLAVRTLLSHCWDIFC